MRQLAAFLAGHDIFWDFQFADPYKLRNNLVEVPNLTSYVRMPEFEALPLEKKIARLFKMEAITLGETFSYVVNSPMKVIEKVGDVIAEFGMKIENEAKKATRPAEPATAPKAEKAADPKQKPKAPRKPAPPRAAKP